jgi:hypothetical protein
MLFKVCGHVHVVRLMTINRHVISKILTQASSEQKSSLFDYLLLYVPLENQRYHRRNPRVLPVGSDDAEMSDMAYLYQ